MSSLTSQSVEKVLTDKFECSLIEEGILYFRYFENKVIELSDVKQGLEIGLNLSPSADTKVVVHVERYVTFTKEAREFLQENMRSVKAEAHVIQQLANKIVFSLFIKWRVKKHPLKAFSNLEKALEWIRGF